MVGYLASKTLRLRQTRSKMMNSLHLTIALLIVGWITCSGAQAGEPHRRATNRSMSRVTPQVRSYFRAGLGQPRSHRSRWNTSLRRQSAGSASVRANRDAIKRSVVESERRWGNFAHRVGTAGGRVAGAVVGSYAGKGGVRVGASIGGRLGSWRLRSYTRNAPRISGTAYHYARGYAGQAVRDTARRLRGRSVRPSR